jgi:hypothetical protein
MPSSKPHQLDLYPANWLAIARKAIASPGMPRILLTMASEPRSAVETQQRKMRAFIEAIRQWPRAAPDLSAALADGHVIKTFTVREGETSQGGLTSLGFVAQKPRGHEIELVKKALMGD